MLHQITAVVIKKVTYFK